MNGTPASPVMRRSRSPIISACFSSSIAHGPPMSARGAPPPIVTAPIVTARVSVIRASRGSSSPGALMVQRGLDERGEERMRLPRPRAEFRVELAGHEPGMVRQLDDLDQLLVRPDPRDPKPALHEGVEIVVVDLEAMTMPLLDRALAVGLRCRAALLEDDRVEAQPHRAALVLDVPLLGQQIDHVVARRGIELRGVRAGQPGDVTGELDDRALHAEADPEVRNALLPRIANGLDLPFDPAIAETAGHQDAIQSLQMPLESLPLDPLCVHPGDLDRRLVRDAAMGQRLVEALVRVLHLDVLADHADATAAPGRLDPAYDLLPAGEISRTLRQSQQLHDAVVQALVVERERDLVDRVDVARGDHRILFDVAEQRDLGLDSRSQRMVLGGAAQ